MELNIKALDNFLQDKTFLSGERLSIADLLTASLIKNACEKSLIDKSFSNHKNINRYYNTVVNQPEFSKCADLEILKESSADLMEALERAETKPKDPFTALPPTSFNFDDYKRCFSNNPPEVYLPYFWEKFDAENCSIWLCEYKFKDELNKNLAFQSANLIRGFLQRLDKARKQSLGSVAVYGQDHNNIIAGLWVWRGQDLMFKLTEDWQVDYESFDWKKLDPKSDETKNLVELFFKQSEDSTFQGMKYADGKIFK